jgi:hypothetical protein
MKVRLMFADRDADRERPPPPHADDLVRDLGADAVLQAMGGGDRLLDRISRTELLDGLADPDAVGYRQAVLRDLLTDPTLASELYRLAGDALATKQQVRFGWLPNASPTAVLSRGVRLMQLLVEHLRRLRDLADTHGDRVRSDGLTALFTSARTELTEAYLQQVSKHLTTLEFRRDIPVSRTLGRGLSGHDEMLHSPNDFRRRLLDWVPLAHDRYTYVLPDRDDAGAQALEVLRNRAVNHAANALGQSLDNVLAFFAALQWEAGFYLGCLNLHQRLEHAGAPCCIPAALPAGPPVLKATGLYDVGLLLRSQSGVVGSDITARGRPLVVITGANQGGKSTFLRAVGLAQLMLQAGMFVAADTLTASVSSMVRTHFKREEDHTMRSGKLDEELRRMSALVDDLSAGALVLSNESFASTNEREGSRLAGDVFGGLADAGVRVVAVTHLGELARMLHADRSRQVVFLRAERRQDGTRPYRLVQGDPLTTSYGDDLYQRVFGPDNVTAAREPETKRAATTDRDRSV